MFAFKSLTVATALVITVAFSVSTVHAEAATQYASGNCTTCKPTPYWPGTHVPTTPPAVPTTPAKPGLPCVTGSVPTAGYATQGPAGVIVFVTNNTYVTVTGNTGIVNVATGGSVIGGSAIGGSASSGSVTGGGTSGSATGGAATGGSATGGSGLVSGGSGTASGGATTTATTQSIATGYNAALTTSAQAQATIGQLGLNLPDPRSNELVTFAAR